VWRFREFGLNGFTSQSGGGRRRGRGGFSLLEVLISIAVIGVLLSVLLPLLSHARRAGYRAVCASSLRQIGSGWSAYVQDHQDQFPLAADSPQWLYGGVSFVGAERTPAADPSRPINAYIMTASQTNPLGASELARVFHCPADAGVWKLPASGRRGVKAASVLGESGGETCFSYFGNSYRANPYLLDSTLAGIDKRGRAIRLHEILNDTSRVLVAGDPIWSYVITPNLDAPTYPGMPLDASWHADAASGNFLAVDGSIRFTNFLGGGTTDFTLRPRP